MLITTDAMQNRIHSNEDLILARCQKLATWKWSLLHRRRCRKNTRAESRNRGEQCLSRFRPGCHREMVKHRSGWHTRRHRCSYNVSNTFTNTTTSQPSYVLPSVYCCVFYVLLLFVQCWPHLRVSTFCIHWLIDWLICVNQYAPHEDCKQQE